VRAQHIGGVVDRLAERQLTDGLPGFSIAESTSVSIIHCAKRSRW
jgi:hypothetical protein